MGLSGLTALRAVATTVQPGAVSVE